MARLIDRLGGVVEDRMAFHGYRLGNDVEWELGLTLVPTNNGMLPSVMFLVGCPSPVLGQPKMVNVTIVPNPMDMSDDEADRMVYESVCSLEEMRAKALHPAQGRGSGPAVPGNPALGPSMLWPPKE